MFSHGRGELHFFTQVEGTNKELLEDRRRIEWIAWISKVVAVNERRSSATIVARLNQLATAGCQFAIDVRWLKISSLLEVFFSFSIVALHMSSLNRLKSYVFIHVPHMLVAFRNSHIASLIVIVKGFLIIGVQVLPSFLVDLPQAH